MAWEQAMRFLTDYLNGDIYYKTDYEGHNLVRTKAQVRYLEVLEENSEVMEKIVKDWWSKILDFGFRSKEFVSQDRFRSFLLIY